MAELLVDTDVLVDHLRTGSGRALRQHRLSYSVITRAELFAGRADQEPRVTLLLDAMDELPVDRAIAELGGQLRRDERVALPDALIAATAIRHGLELVTRNRRHFERLPGLRLHG